MTLTLTLTFGEVGNVSYERMQYDSFFQCVVLQCMQTKVSKMKLVPLIVGYARDACWLLAYADELVLNSKFVYDPNESCWLLPEVHGANSGTKMSSIVKGMQPAGKTGHLVAYKDFSVPSLPEAPKLLRASGRAHVTRWRATSRPSSLCTRPATT